MTPAQVALAEALRANAALAPLGAQCDEWVDNLAELVANGALGIATGMIGG
jgi:hypothetical protein